MTAVTGRRALRSVRGFVVVALCAATVFAFTGTPAATAAGNHLYSYQPPLVVDSTNKGDVWSCYIRPKRPMPLVWGGKEYMLLNSSTDIQIWDPGSASLVAQGHFSVGAGCQNGPVPDGFQTAQGPDAVQGADGVLQINVCDECRWGMFNGLQGMYTFDLGAPSPNGQPILKKVQYYDVTTSGATYKIGNTQYVVIGGDYGSPFQGKCPSGEMGVYTFDSSGNISSSPVQCIADTATFHPKEARQFKVLNTSTGALEDFLIYRQSSNHDTYIVKLGANGLPIFPPVNSTPWEGSNFDYFTLDTYDLADDSKPPAGPRGYLLITNTAQSPYATVYQLTPDGNGGLNINTVWVNSESEVWDTGAIHYPYVFLNTLSGPPAPRRMIDISQNPPAFIDFDYWNDPDGSEDYNQAGAVPGRMVDHDAYFSPDGQWLYFARYYQMSRFKFSPSNPIANVAVSPTTAFWGDPVTVDGGGSAGAAEYAIWIDDDSTGLNQQAHVYTGTPPWSGGWGVSTTLNWTLPNNGAAGPYFAHVAVRDVARGYPYDPTNHPEMLANQKINLNTSPQPHITIDGNEGPFTVMLNDQVTLSAATSDGNPTSYSWTVVAPSGTQYTGSGQTMTQRFDERTVGTAGWSVTVLVEWANGEYSADTTTTVEVKSAVADFTFSPEYPRENDPISLDASASKPDGQLSYAWKVLSGSNPVWTGSGVNTTIPANTLSQGTYTLRLVVTNTSTQETDTMDKTLTVLAEQTGNLAISPSNPEIGQQVVFNIGGIQNINSVYWHYGGASCDGSPTDYNCQGGYPVCTNSTYTYKSAGTHSVRADVSTDSGTVTLSGSVTVQNSGQCSGSGCSYGVSITRTSFPASGGNAAVTVSAGGGCSWTAASNRSWLTLDKTSGSGGATISFTVAANSGGQRTASITVSGTNFAKTYNVTQSGTGGGGSGSLAISNDNPQKGETVTFTLNGFSGISKVVWHFDGASCDGSPKDQTCTGQFCTATSYAYRDAGTKSVSAVVTSDSGDTTVTGTVTVQDAGQCSGGTCSYTLQPGKTSFGPAGGTGTVTVQTDAGCSWNATTTAPQWLHITGNGAGSGSGSFTFAVDQNTGTEIRSGSLVVKGKSVKITQSGVSKGDFLVSAAANIPGEKGTHWQTDLCIFNPNGQAQATVHVLFLPEAISGPADPIDLTPQGAVIREYGTLCLQDVLASESDSKGALRVQVENPEDLDNPVVVTSRTYTKQPNGEGTYGQNVPGQVVSTGPVTGLMIGGLQHYQNEDGSGYRTAIGLVNQTDKTIGGIMIYLYTKDGVRIGPIETGVFANGYVQIDRVVEKILGAGATLRDFSVVIRFKDADGNEGAAKRVSAYASMVDDITGDAVFIPATPVP